MDEVCADTSSSKTAEVEAGLRSSQMSTGCDPTTAKKRHGDRKQVQLFQSDIQAMPGVGKSDNFEFEALKKQRQELDSQRADGHQEDRISHTTLIHLHH